MNIGVIGGGVSGIRAALTLARAGYRVTLFEKNKHLGGRVFSFLTPDFGEVDIGQHIWLRCCTAIEQLLADLAVPDEWIFRQDRVAMTYRYPDGDVRILAANWLPGSLSLLPMLWGARLGWLDTLKYLWSSLRARFYFDSTLETLDNITMAQWLHDQGQPAAAIELFWEPFIVGVCNARLDKVSARHGLFAMRESLFRSGYASAICFLRRPLSAVFDGHARKVLAQSGVDVRTGAAINQIMPGTPVTVCDNVGRQHDFDKVILALPLKRMRMLLPQANLPEAPGEGAIAGLLLKFAQPVMDEMFFSAVGSLVQVVFNKTAIWQKPSEDGSQIVEVVISAAEREAKLGVERVSGELLPELAKLLPRVASTPLLAKRLLVHATATFHVQPGGEARRLPIARPDLANILFAGDYAMTGWPSTMESGIRAGESAARVILEGTT
ncbi:MAG: FAD-dependent oxidoreductase [Planctomycetes bacterium]|nr:FAD-dependent oxidoreductase [Planctomycetota bacterium]